jgi:nicotinamide-nucleotide amidase
MVMRYSEDNMREILRCYGESEELEALLKMGKPELDGYRMFSKSMDTMIVFDDISEDDYDDALEILDEYIYNDEDISLAQTLVSFLKKNKLVIATAESCTGGLLASAIIEVAGASEVFYEGLVTYSNLSKMRRLRVKDSTLQQFGAVSQETALEMANALLDENVCIGVSVTGIAGPGGGSENKPVGLVYIGIAGENSCDIIKKVFSGDRRRIRECAANTALFYTLQHIKKYY